MLKIRPRHKPKNVKKISMYVECNGTLNQSCSTLEIRVSLGSTVGGYLHYTDIYGELSHMEIEQCNTARDLLASILYFKLFQMLKNGTAGPFIKHMSKALSDVHKKNLCVIEQLIILPHLLLIPLCLVI